MPTYTFRNKNTQEHFDKLLKYDQKKDFLEENPDLEEIFTSMPPLGDAHRMGLRGTDSGFKEVLHKIASANYGSNLKSKLSRN